MLDAPRERVWQALTDPEHMKDWWSAAGFTMIAMTMDLRPGGFFHCGMRSAEGYKIWGKFAYQEIVPPERLVFVNYLLQRGRRRSPATRSCRPGRWKR